MASETLRFASTHIGKLGIIDFTLTFFTFSSSIGTKGVSRGNECGNKLSGTLDTAPAMIGGVKQWWIGFQCIVLAEPENIAPATVSHPLRAC